jgi:hypothetical protein
VFLKTLQLNMLLVFLSPIFGAGQGSKESDGSDDDDSDDDEEQSSRAKETFIYTKVSAIGAVKLVMEKGKTNK